MNDKTKLDTHDARQSAYRGTGTDASIDGHGRNDPSAAQDGEIPVPRDGKPEELNQHDHGRGGGVGEAEPDAQPQRDGSTQPNFGQTGTYGKQQHIQAQQRALEDTDKDA
ncbi:hypothetical protein [Xanthomonas vesicatoria]|uniref:Uncharacterized protein n=2 Tax=Xanthomonas vesicatoria TaxID=56460 RepID=A0AAJ0N5C7_9XANT|nr:hypothetical protein [Xanthomonas vesicatoria]APO95279.1 hypothetical protein BI313_12325 [Xanthomonas vesicatoria]APP75453.1 hypothetical protein BJD12_09530 [Xanthomonas vesicatoria ATCC 35937]EGD11623.1 hypothetical protein XVE_0131 [Xanthomonas vesicatoria ATCC 35937]KHM91437.1 hypothetical protein OR60_19615 [Xanthomonas vesicatoria]KHM97373.1 hypothetical protein OR61_04070 [Xanthomonas vesicatoria]